MMSKCTIFIIQNDSADWILKQYFIIVKMNGYQDMPCGLKQII